MGAALSDRLANASGVYLLLPWNALTAWADEDCGFSGADLVGWPSCPCLPTTRVFTNLACLGLLFAAILKVPIY